MIMNMNMNMCVENPLSSRRTQQHISVNAHSDRPCCAAVLQRNKPVQVRWVNELFDMHKRYKPHLLADQLDQTLHW
jgi:hypothetical protein